MALSVPLYGQEMTRRDGIGSPQDSKPERSHASVRLYYYYCRTEAAGLLVSEPERPK